MKLDVERINKARRRRGVSPLPVRRGRPSIGETPSRAELVDAYQRQGLSIRAAAEILGTSKEAVWRGLAEHGIPARPNTRPSRLATYSLTDLRRRIRRDGLRGTARVLGVSAPTLLDYLRRHGPKK
jgi:transposase